MNFGNILGNLWGGIKNIGSSIGGGINNLFGGSQQQPQTGTTGASLLVPKTESKGFGGIADLFGGSKGIAGLGMMGLSQMIPQAKAPSMPSDYSEFMNMMKGGGTQGMQSANQYYQGVLSGQNQGAYDASTESLDQTFEDEQRKLISMYKTLRPGTDPSTDATFQRDLAQLQNNYARQRALTRAGVQQGAAQGLAGLGTQQMSGMAQGIQAQIDQIAAQWGMSASQREALRNSIMNLGGSMVDPDASFNDLWKKTMMQKLLNGGIA